MRTENQKAISEGMRLHWLERKRNRKMKISVSDLVVITDTLLGSLKLTHDRLGLFSYEKETREQVVQRLLHEMNKTNITLGKENDHNLD